MNIFITGKPGCGKSSLVKEIIEFLKTKKIKFAGIVTPEIRKNNQREGFKILDLVSGKQEILASVNTKSKYKVGKYGVNIRSIDKIVDIFSRNYDNADITIVDELGKMEMFSKKFKLLINKILENNKINIITIGLSFLNKFKNKGKVFYLNRDNFAQTKNKIIEIIKKNAN